MNITDKLLELSNDVAKLVREHTYMVARSQGLEAKIKEYLESKELLADFQEWLVAEEAKNESK